MLNLTVAVILHGITLTGHLGSIDSASCSTAAQALSGDNWAVSCTGNDINPNWTIGGIRCIVNEKGLMSCP